jgi:Copper binding proteins, plastocyanin/azurin family
MTRSRLSPLILLLAFGLLAACSRESKPADAAPAKTSAPSASAGGHRVAGRVLTPDGVLAIVTLRPREPREFPKPSDPAIEDQVAKTFAPELLFARAGLPVVFRNSDAYLHNVNVKNDETLEQAFNVAIPSGGLYSFTFAQDGVYRVTCDIHPEMMAWVVAAPSPYATQTSPDGRFSFDNVPAGPYVVVAYVDKRKFEQEIDVGGAEGAEEKITVDAQGS